MTSAQKINHNRYDLAINWTYRSCRLACSRKNVMHNAIKRIHNLTYMTQICAGIEEEGEKRNRNFRGNKGNPNKMAIYLRTSGSNYSVN